MRGFKGVPVSWAKVVVGFHLVFEPLLFSPLGSYYVTFLERCLLDKVGASELRARFFNNVPHF